MVQDFRSSIHYHIHWTSKEELDWECFETREEASTRALELALPGESFKIEVVAEKCPLRRIKLRSAG
jgi:hypothetical protein